MDECRELGLFGVGDKGGEGFREGLGEGFEGCEFLFQELAQDVDAVTEYGFLGVQSRCHLELLRGRVSFLFYLGIFLGEFLVVFLGGRGLGGGSRFLVLVVGGSFRIFTVPDPEGLVDEFLDPGELGSCDEFSGCRYCKISQRNI